MEIYEINVEYKLYCTIELEASTYEEAKELACDELSDNGHSSTLLKVYDTDFEIE